MKIAITGDLFLQHPDTVTISDRLKQLMSCCDYRIVNLEGPLLTSDINDTPLKSGPKLKQSKSVLRFLEDLDINVLTLANNHILDYGIKGFLQTIDTLRGRYLLTGCGSWEEAYKMAVFEKDGLKVGVLNYCEMQFGMLHDKWSQSSDQLGCAWVNHPDVDGLLLNFKKQVDKLIVICHAGVEQVAVPLPEWRDCYRHFIDLGCDAIIAHHPHIVQGCEIYKGAPICYSLGNFLFVSDGSSDNEEWNTGAIAMLEVKKEGINLTTYGVRVHNRKQLELLPDNIWNTFVNERSALLDSPVYLNEVNKACLRLYSMYQSVFAMGGLFPADRYWLKSLARILLHRYNPVHVLNSLQCESHRWCISRAILLKDKSIC